MPFNWNQPPAGAAAQAAAQAPAPAAFGGPPQALNVHQALAGFADAPIDVRDPFLPPGAAVIVKLRKTEGRKGRETGLALYITGEVTAVAAPGGGPEMAQMCAGMKSVNLVPARVGSMHSMRIDGFDRENARAFAFSDLKTFILAACESKGLKADTAITPDQWNGLANAAFQGQLGVDGAEFGVRTEVVPTKAGFKKLKHTFYPLSAVRQQG